MDRRAFLTTGLAAGAAAATAAAAAECPLERNKALTRRFAAELWGKGDVALADELLSADFVNHNPFPGTAGDREGEKQALRTHEPAFVDREVAVDDQIAEADKVVTRFTFCATHQGAFLGIAPTGKRVKLTGINIHRVKDGKIVEMWREVDVLGMFGQLGVKLPPG